MCHKFHKRHFADYLTQHNAAKKFFKPAFSRFRIKIPIFLFSDNPQLRSILHNLTMDVTIRVGDALLLAIRLLFNLHYFRKEEFAEIIRFLN